MPKKPLRIWTSVWGDKHIDWFEKLCVHSLQFGRNKEALAGATWVVSTRQTDRERIEKIIDSSGIQIANKEFMLFGDGFDAAPHSAGAFINEALVLEISRCIMFDARSLMAPPDTIFGDGTIPNLLELGDQRDVVVFAAHVRVTPDIIEPFRKDEKLLTNARLVGLAWKHLHKTWTEAEFGRDKINSYVGGVFWRYLCAGLYGVSHRLPTPYLINYTPEDLVYFRNQLHWGVIDHAWPHECLIHTERQRVVGSSDAAFMVEITPADQNIPPLEHYRHDSPDLFWKNLSHNKQNRMYQIIFRGE